MKTLYFIFISVSLIAGLRAQIPANAGGPLTAEEKTPASIQEKFKKEYPDVTPTWRKDEKYYVADFTDTNSFKGTTIAYDKNGNVVRRESEMENSTYPAAINNYFVKNYPGEKFKTWKSLDETGEQKYCIKREYQVLWFDKEGNYIDPEKKNEQTASAD